MTNTETQSLTAEINELATFIDSFSGKQVNLDGAHSISNLPVFRVGNETILEDLARLDVSATEHHQGRLEKDARLSLSEEVSQLLPEKLPRLFANLLGPVVTDLPSVSVSDDGVLTVTITNYATLVLNRSEAAALSAILIYAPQVPMIVESADGAMRGVLLNGRVNLTVGEVIFRMPENIAMEAGRRIASAVSQ